MKTNYLFPTHPSAPGRNYVDQRTSRNQNLTFASSDTFILGADSEHVLDPNGPGRNSVRIKSRKTYTQHVAVYVLVSFFLFFWQFFVVAKTIHSESQVWYPLYATRMWVRSLLVQLRPRKKKRYNVDANRTWPAVWEVGKSWPNDVSTSSRQLPSISLEFFLGRSRHCWGSKRSNPESVKFTYNGR